MVLYETVNIPHYRPVSNSLTRYGVTVSSKVHKFHDAPCIRRHFHNHSKSTYVFMTKILKWVYEWNNPLSTTQYWLPLQFSRLWIIYTKLWILCSCAPHHMFITIFAQLFRKHWVGRLRIHLIPWNIISKRRVLNFHTYVNILVLI